MNAFTLLCFLYSALALIVAIRNRFFPPKKFSWYSGVQIKEALKSLDSWHEANRFIAIPLLVTGIVFFFIALLPLFFPQVLVFSFTSATVLIATSNLALIFGTKKHLRDLFDKEGNRR